MSKTVDLFIIAAEPSADLLGAKLIAELLALKPDLHIAAMSGPHMRKLPIQTLFSMESLQVMGFIDVLFSLPKIAKTFVSIRKQILTLNPKAVICIDYPGFNLRLEKSLRKKGYTGKLIHYICPTVWAWGKKRIPLMAKHIDLLLTLFPFEKTCFAHTTLPVSYVGHPLLQIIPQKPFERNTKILALFPGSRDTEIERNLPIQILIAKKLKQQNPLLDIAISISHMSKESKIRVLAQDLHCRFIPPDKTYSLMQEAQLALATSGTVTLELALHGTPTLVNFVIRPLDLFLAQKIFRINLPFYCIVNIIASEEIFPEFFGSNLTQPALLDAAKNFLYDEKLREDCKKKCHKMRELLADQNNTENAPSLIVDSIYK